MEPRLGAETSLKNGLIKKKGLRSKFGCLAIYQFLLWFLTKVFMNLFLVSFWTKVYATVELHSSNVALLWNSTKPIFTISSQSADSRAPFEENHKKLFIQA